MREPGRAGSVMAPAPKRSPAQARAAKAYAAAGVRGQAKAKAARGGKATRKQHAAAVKWAAAGRASQARSRAAAKTGKKAPVVAKKAALPASRSPAGTLLWLPGCNNERPTCAVTAIANHLLAITGVTATDAQILSLHEKAGGDDGASISSVLDAAAEHGLAGIKLQSFGMAEQIWPGMICGVTTRRGYHAVLSHEYGLISWGLLMPHFGSPEEAWHLTWELDRA